MIDPKPTVLERDGIRLEPMSYDHRDGLADAAADGELWRLWYTSVPDPPSTQTYIADALKGQMPLAFAVLKDASKNTGADEVMQTVDRQLGAIARPRAVHFVTLLPKTRSGKTLRRAIQALAEGRDPGDLTTIEDPAALEQIRKALKP